MIYELRLPSDPHSTTSLSSVSSVPVHSRASRTSVSAFATCKMFRTAPRMAGFVFRENRVPYYQRLFQKHDGRRQWYKTSRSPLILYPYLISVYGLGAATLYAMGRMVFGHKTWIGKD